MRHSAKNTRQNFDRQRGSVFYRALGKGFAECPGDTRQRKATVTAPVPLQSLCRVPTLQALGKDFFNFFKKNSLSSVFYRALGKGFAESPGGTRQRKATVTAPAPLTVALPSANHAGTHQIFLFFLKKILCRVPSIRPSATMFYFFSKNSLLSAPWPALGKV